MYGWRARVGIVFPSRGDTFTYEFYKMAPKGIVLVFSGLNLSQLTEAQLRTAVKKYDKAAKDLAQVGVDVIVLSGSPLFQLQGVGSDKEAIERVQKMTKVKVTTGITAEIEALRHLNIKKPIVATPFKDELNKRSQKFLEAHHFKILGIKGLGIQRNSEIADLPLHAPYKLAKELFLKHRDADGIYITCPRWGTIEIIEKLEQDLKIPVVTAVQATLWCALRMLDIREPIKGYGRLLAHD